MKDMVYQENISREVLDRGTYRGYDYVVISEGPYPCGYVRLPERHPYYDKKKDFDAIKCHGGITYCDKMLEMCNGTFLSGHWIGWDYNHGTDYVGYIPEKGGKRYSTEEVKQSCIDVIEQLIDIKSRHLKE